MKEEVLVSLLAVCNVQHTPALSKYLLELHSLLDSLKTTFLQVIFFLPHLSLSSFALTSPQDLRLREIVPHTHRLIYLAYIFANSM